jgi:preprotein translocase subunit SecE
MTSPTSPVVVRPGLGTRLVTFYHDVIAEMKKVTWPDRPQLQQATIQIIVFVLVLGALIALIDVALQMLLVRLPAMLTGR